MFLRQLACAFVLASSEVCTDSGCADQSSLLQTDAERASKKKSTLSVMSFQPYYNYEGGLYVQGSLSIKVKGKKMSMSWDISGADANCGYVDYPNGKISNDCGIHIHVGTSCTEDAGGHYWIGGSDPWQKIHYDVSKSYQPGGVGTLGRSIDSASINAGLTDMDALGHAVIVHDITGARIACGILISEEELDAVSPAVTVPSFMPYPDYTGPLTVTGSMSIYTIDDVQYMSWNLKGGDHNCGITNLPNGPVSNDCGIHIHTGTTCDNASEVGGHYYSSPTDPWKMVHYNSYGGKMVQTGARVNASLSESAILGHAMVVHNLEGGRIACGIIASRGAERRRKSR